MGLFVDCYCQKLGVHQELYIFFHVIPFKHQKSILFGFLFLVTGFLHLEFLSH